MKRRNGFVSNSSSSSFVLITTQENWEQVKPDLSSLEVTVAEAIMGKPTEAFDKQLVTFSTWTNPGGSWDEHVYIDHLDDADADEAPEDSIWGAWSAVEKKLKQGDYITHHQDVG